MGLKSGYWRKGGSQIWLWKKKKGLKYVYGNKLGSQIWLGKQIGVSQMVMEENLF